MKYSMMKVLGFFGGDVRTQTIKRNVLASFAIRGVSILVSLALVPMTLGYVSSEIYGIWLTLSSIIVWVGFFDVGFNLGLKNKLAEAIALGDYERGRALVSTTYFLMAIIFIPLGFVFEFLLPLINWSSLLNINPQYEPEVLLAMHVLVACFCMNMIASVLTSVIAAHQKTALSQVFPVIGNIISLVVIFLMTKYCPPSLSALTMAVSSIPIFVLIVSSFVLYKTFFIKVKPSISLIDRKYIKDLFNLGVKFFIIKLQIVVLFQMTNFLISHISGPNDVTAYNIAYKYLHVGVMAYTIILDPLWPAFTDALTKKDFSWMKNVYKRMTHIFLLLVCGLILMIFLSKVAYNLWIGEKAYVPLLMTLSVGIYNIISAWVQLQVLLINGTGKIELQTYVTMIGLFLHIPLSLFLGQWFNGLGVIYSMSIINIIYALFFTTQIRRIINQQAIGIWAK